MFCFNGETVALIVENHAEREGLICSHLIIHFTF